MMTTPRSMMTSEDLEAHLADKRATIAERVEEVYADPAVADRLRLNGGLVPLAQLRQRSSVITPRVPRGPPMRRPNSSLSSVIWCMTWNSFVKCWRFRPMWASRGSCAKSGWASSRG